MRVYINIYTFHLFIYFHFLFAYLFKRERESARICVCVSLCASIFASLICYTMMLCYFFWLPSCHPSRASSGSQSSLHLVDFICFFPFPALGVGFFDRLLPENPAESPAKHCTLRTQPFRASYRESPKCTPRPKHLTPQEYPLWWGCSKYRSSFASAHCLPMPVIAQCPALTIAPRTSTLDSRPGFCHRESQRANYVPRSWTFRLIPGTHKQSG